MVEIGEIQKRLIDEIVDGAGIYGIEKAIEFLKDASYGYTVKNLKQYTDGAIKLSLSLVDLLFPKIKELPYVGDWLQLIGRVGIRDVAKAVIDRPPFCYASDSNTIMCYNFDTTKVSLKIDGASVEPSVSGTPEELTLSLPSPMGAGKHDVLVAGDKVAWHGKVVV